MFGSQVIHRIPMLNGAEHSKKADTTVAESLKVFTFARESRLSDAEESELLKIGLRCEFPFDAVALDDTDLFVGPKQN